MFPQHSTEEGKNASVKNRHRSRAKGDMIVQYLRDQDPSPVSYLAPLVEHDDIFFDNSVVEVFGALLEWINISIQKHMLY